MKPPLSLVEADPARLLADAVAHARLCDGQGTAYFMPEPIDEGLDAAIALAEARLVPAGRDRAFQGIDFAVKVLGCRRPGNDVLSAYASILGELPADLLPVALRGGLAGQPFHMLPAPGAFMLAVAGEWQERKAQLGALQRHRNRVRLVSRTRFPRTPKLEAVTIRPVPAGLRGPRDTSS